MVRRSIRHEDSFSLCRARDKTNEYLPSPATFQTVLFLNILGLPHRAAGLLVNKKELSARVAFSLCDRMKALLIPFEGF